MTLCPADHLIQSADGFDFSFLDIVLMPNKIKFYVWKILK